MPFYRTILKQSWVLTWRHKYLWWFGIFAALLGNGGELEILFNKVGAGPGQALFPSWQRIISTGIFSRQTLPNVWNLFRHDALNLSLVLITGLILLAIGLFLVYLVIVSQAALVNNSAAIIREKKPAFKDGLDAGMLNFWPALVLNIIIKAVIYILLVIISLPLIFFQRNFSANLFYVLALIIIVPVAIILSFIMKYAIAYAVINKSQALQAIKLGWRLFKENWLVSFEMAVMLFFINLLVGLVMVLAILVLAVPFLFLGLVFYYGFSLVGSWLVAILAFTSFLFIVVAIGAALAVFQISAWTGLFLALEKKGVTSKLVRLVNKMVKA